VAQRAKRAATVMPKINRSWEPPAPAKKRYYPPSPEEANRLASGIQEELDDLPPNTRDELMVLFGESAKCFGHGMGVWSAAELLVRMQQQGHLEKFWRPERIHEPLP